MYLDREGSCTILITWPLILRHSYNTVTVGSSPPCTTATYPPNHNCCKSYVCLYVLKRFVLVHADKLMYMEDLGAAGVATRASWI